MYLGKFCLSFTFSRNPIFIESSYEVLTLICVFDIFKGKKIIREYAQYEDNGERIFYYRCVDWLYHRTVTLTVKSICTLYQSDCDTDSCSAIAMLQLQHGATAADPNFIRAKANEAYDLFATSARPILQHGTNEEARPSLNRVGFPPHKPCDLKVVNRVYVTSPADRLLDS